MSSTVKQIRRLSSRVVSIGNVDYVPQTIPDEFIFVFNIFTEEVEEKMLRLIQSGSEADKKEVNDILSCMSKEFEGEVGCKFNNRTVTSVVAGQEWREVQDLKYFNPCIIVINLGSQTNLILRNKKTRATTQLIVPRRCMYLYRDPNDLYERSTDRKLVDLIDNNEVKRETRYSIVFKSRK